MSTLLRFSKVFVLTGVLVACGRGPEAPDQTRAPSDVVTTPIAASLPLVTREFQYVTTVTTGADDTVQGLEREFGGRVAAFSPNSGYALIATNDVTSLKSQAHTKAQRADRGQPRRVLRRWIPRHEGCRTPDALGGR
jgi:hypothetical protein